MDINQDNKRKVEKATDSTGVTEQQPCAATSDLKLPFPELPTKMRVVIEGASDASRRPIAEKVAQALGAVLIDAGRYLRSLKLSCVEAGADLKDREAVVMHCAGVNIDVWVRNQGGLFDEALCFVNSDLFTASELAAFDEQPICQTVKATSDAMVRYVLRKLPENGRTVMLGRELNGFLYHTTPFRFIVSGTSDAEYKPGKPIYYASFAGEEADAMKIDGRILTTAQTCEKILAELMLQHARNEEWIKRHGPLLWKTVKAKPLQE